MHLHVALAMVVGQRNHGVGTMGWRKTVCLAYAYATGTIVCMRTTLDIDEDLVARVMSATHATTKTAAVEMGLRELLAKAAREELAALYGSDPVAKAPPRRRSDRRS